MAVMYGRTHRGGLSQAEAAEVLGVSERTFRRWRDRYEAEGADGLYDRRLGRLSARRAPVDEVARVLELFDTRYWDFTAKHFHLVADHGFKRSYNELHRRRAAPMRGAHRRNRPARRCAPGRLEPRVGPRRYHVTMDDATSDIYSAFFVAEEGTMSRGGVRGDPGQGPVLLALRPTAPATTGTRPRPAAWTRTPRPRSAAPWRSSASFDSPEARGRSERMFGTLQSACPRNSGSPPTGRGQPLPQGGLPATTQRPLRDPGRGPGHRLRPLHRRARRHPVHPRGTHRLKRQHGALQAPGTSDPRRPPPPPLRQGQGPRPRIPRRHNGRLPWTAMSGAIPRRWPTDRQPNPRGRVTRFDATDRRPVDKWTAAPRPTTSPQGQKPQQKRSTHMVHKPVNSECSRQQNRPVGAGDTRLGRVGFLLCS